MCLRKLGMIFLFESGAWPTDSRLMAKMYVFDVVFHRYLAAILLMDEIKQLPGGLSPLDPSGGNPGRAQGNHMQGTPGKPPRNTRGTPWDPRIARGTQGTPWDPPKIMFFIFLCCEEF